MKKVLVIEDDTQINNLIVDVLRINKYEYISAYSGTEGLLLHDKSVDLILLDLMLPGKNGEDIIKELKKIKNVPIIIMSAISDVDKKVDMFKIGADDYVTKPFNNDELVARIELQLKHYNNMSFDENILKLKDIELNEFDYTVKCNGKNINLTKNEFELLKALMLKPNQVVTKNNLIDFVWSGEDSSDDNNLNVHISKLRSKLKNANPSEEYIETIWSIGYRMKN